MNDRLPCGHPVRKPACRVGKAFRAGTDCHQCHLYHNLPETAVGKVLRRNHPYPQAESEPPAPAADPAEEPVVGGRAFPCDFEGPVIQYATCDCHMKHIRWCLLGGDEAPVYDRCSRGHLQGNPVQQCYRCPDRTIDGVKVGPTRHGLTPLRVLPAD